MLQSNNTRRKASRPAPGYACHEPRPSQPKIQSYGYAIVVGVLSLSLGPGLVSMVIVKFPSVHFLVRCIESFG